MPKLTPIVPSPSLASTIRLGEALGRDPRLGRLGLRHQDRELVAADAEGVVGDPGLVDQPGDLAQHVVAGRVAEAVVDRP